MKSGKSVFSASLCIIGKSLSGPNEQLTPRASANAPAVNANASTGQPVKVLPFSSKVILHITSSLVFSFTASNAALSSYKSLIVSMTTRLAPAFSPATACSLYISYASSKVILPSGSMSAPVGPKSSATSLSPAALLAIFTAASIIFSTSPFSLSFLRFAPKVLV